jgi:predicted RNase H-like nuclease (RuvC/YqgF family)
MSYPATFENVLSDAAKTIQRLQAENERLQRELGECQAGWETGKRALEENERLQRSHDRYEYLRRLNPRQFSELCQSNIRGDGTFDDLVDRRIAKADD